MKYLIDTNILLEILPINYRARVHKKTAVDDPPWYIIPTALAKFMKTSAIEDPLLKVPPARRGNRVGARLCSPREAGGTCRRGAIVNSARAIGIKCLCSEI